MKTDVNEFPVDEKIRHKTQITTRNIFTLGPNRKKLRTIKIAIFEEEK